jgi:hypothetical protein
VSRHEAAAVAVAKHGSGVVRKDLAAVDQADQVCAVGIDQSVELQKACESLGFRVSYLGFRL